MRPKAIVFPSPALDKDLRFRQRIQHLAVEKLIPELSDIGLDVAVFPGASGLDEECGYAKVFEPVPDCVRREFRAVVRCPTEYVQALPASYIARRVVPEHPLT